MKNQKINKKVAFVVTAILLLCLIALAISPAIASTKQNALSGQETQITEQESLPKSMLNSVVFITFEQQGDNYPYGFFDNVYRMYQTSATSVKNYVKHQSGGLLNVDTNVLNQEQTVVKVSNPANYYKPRYRWINNTYELVNELGYDNRYYSEDGSVVDYQSQRGKLNVEYALREQQLIREVVEKLELDSNYCTDADYDGIVDSLVIITDLSTTVEWGEVLWAHMGTCHNFTDNVLNTFYYTDEQKSECQNLKNIMLGNAFVLSYNMIPLGNITSAKAANYNPCIAEEDDDLYNVGLLCHEFMHTLGIYDYYSYQDGTYESVGEFDLMATTNPAPQNMLAYLRYKLGWLDYNDWLYVNDSGTYTLYPSLSGKGASAVKIVLSDYLTTGEYFMAEVRSRKNATEDIPFDGSLSDNGLIIYRVNQEAGYINSSGNLGTVDLGNMYGEDSVYVYRVGNGKSVNGATNLVSYSLFGKYYNPEKPEETRYVLTTELCNYDMASFGNSDLTKTEEKLVSGFYVNSETAVLYSNGKNSGIVFSQITINDDGSVTFDVQLPETQGNMPVLNPNDVYISRYIDGTDRLYWQSDVKTGNAYVMVIKATKRMKKLAEEGQSNVTLENFISGQFHYYDVLYRAKVPLAEKYVELPEITENALVFIALQSKNGNCAVRYVGSINNLNPTFSQYLAYEIDYVYMIIAAIVVVLMIIVVILANNYRKNRQKRRRRR